MELFSSNISPTMSSHYTKMSLEFDHPVVFMKCESIQGDSLIRVAHSLRSIDRRCNLPSHVKWLH